MAAAGVGQRGCRRTIVEMQGAAAARCQRITGRVAQRQTAKLWTAAVEAHGHGAAGSASQCGGIARDAPDARRAIHRRRLLVLPVGRRGPGAVGAADPPRLAGKDLDRVMQRDRLVRFARQALAVASQADGAAEGAGRVQRPDQGAAVVHDAAGIEKRRRAARDSHSVRCVVPSSTVSRVYCVSGPLVVSEIGLLTVMPTCTGRNSPPRLRRRGWQ